MESKPDSAVPERVTDLSVPALALAKLAVPSDTRTLSPAITPVSVPPPIVAATLRS